MPDPHPRTDDPRRTPYSPSDAAAREVAVQLRVQVVRATHPDLSDAELDELTQTIARQVDDAEAMHIFELGIDDEPYVVVPAPTGVPLA